MGDRSEPACVFCCPERRRTSILADEREHPESKDLTAPEEMVWMRQEIRDFARAYRLSFLRFVQ